MALVLGFPSLRAPVSGPIRRLLAPVRVRLVWLSVYRRLWCLASLFLLPVQVEEPGAENLMQGEVNHRPFWL